GERPGRQVHGAAEDRGAGELSVAAVAPRERNAPRRLSRVAARPGRAARGRPAARAAAGRPRRGPGGARRGRREPSAPAPGRPAALALRGRARGRCWRTRAATTGRRSQTSARCPPPAAAGADGRPWRARAAGPPRRAARRASDDPRASRAARGAAAFRTRTGEGSVSSDQPSTAPPSPAEYRLAPGDASPFPQKSFYDHWASWLRLLGKRLAQQLLDELRVGLA